MNLKRILTDPVGGVILMVACMLLFWLAVSGPVVATLSKLSNPNVLASMRQSLCERALRY